MNTKNTRSAQTVRCHINEFTITVSREDNGWWSEIVHRPTQGGDYTWWPDSAGQTIAEILYETILDALVESDRPLTPTTARWLADDDHESQRRDRLIYDDDASDHRG